MGINTGILTNATPLSAAQVRELERKVLENGEAFAYLDESNQLCFLSSRTPEAIEELAWNNAYKIAASQDGLIRAEYKKDSLKTYFLDRISFKASLDSDWQLDDLLEGTGAEFYTSAPSALSFRSTAPLNEFQEVVVNGQTVNPANYTLEEGSTIVKLSIDYLETLETGVYDIAVISNNKTVNGSFSVKAPKLNEYGFYYNKPYIYEDLDDPSNNVIIRFTDECTWAAFGTFKFIQVFNPEESNFEIIGVYTVQDGIIYAHDLGSEEQIPLGTVCSDGVIELEGLPLYPINHSDVLSDENFLYVFDASIDGYVVSELRPASSVSYGKIKSNVLDKPVKALAKGAFNMSGVLGADFSHFELPEGLVEIRDNALKYCVLPASFSIPATVRVIGYGAFHTCKYAEDMSIRIPHGVTRLEADTFGANDLYFLDELILPSTISFIGQAACYYVVKIVFDGTMAQWHAIEKVDGWWYHYNLFNMDFHVQCTDGRIDRSYYDE